MTNNIARHLMTSRPTLRDNEWGGNVLHIRTLYCKNGRSRAIATPPVRYLAVWN